MALGSKGPQEIDHLRREFACSPSDHGEAADEVILADEGNRQQGSVASAHQSVAHPALGRRLLGRERLIDNAERARHAARNRRTTGA
jgi:hypothetical protein